MSFKEFMFKHPFTCIIAGPTYSGKTYWMRQFLENWEYLIDKLNKDHLRVLWCHGMDQNLHKIPIENIDVNYYEGVPNTDEIKTLMPDIIVLDDLMNEMKNNIDIKNLFTKTAHHMNISVFYIVQNLFHQDKIMRDISLNTHYVVVMRGPRMTQQIGSFAQQIFPRYSRQIMNVYKDATKEPFSYLLFDLHPLSDEKFSLRTRIFKQELLPDLASVIYSAPICYELK